MAITQYQIFVRYLNENIGKPLTNKTHLIPVPLLTEHLSISI